jgi:hypothetical protein
MARNRKSSPRSQEKRHSPRTCIFCGGAGLNREHMWPAWMQKYAPSGGAEEGYTQVRTRIARITGDTIAEATQIDARQGRIMNKKYPVVCEERCNGGWMKKLEDEVSDWGSRMILGESVRLTPERQAILATWAAKTAIMMEFNDVATRGTSKAQYRHIYEHNEPPPVTLVWIGRYEGQQWKSRFRHIGWLSRMREDPPVHHASRMNSQTTTIVCGQLFIHVAATTVAEFAPPGFRGKTARDLRQIWPIQDGFDWPLQTVLTDDDAEFISHAFWLELLANG